MRIRSPRAVAVLGIGVALSSALALGASPAHADTPYAVVRAAHFSPTTPGVDVYLTPFSTKQSFLWLRSVTYGAVSPYQKISPGTYTVALRLHGSGANTAPAVSWTLHAVAGAAYTAAGVGAGSSVRGVVFGDDLTAPGAGSGRVRVIQAASRAPEVTVTAQGGPVVAQSTPFTKTSPYATVKAGTWSLSAKSTSGSPSTSGTVQIKSGTVTSILVLDAKGRGITLNTVVDSAGTSAMPRGPVGAGGGGMAVTSRQVFDSHGAGVPLPLVAILAVLVTAGAATTMRVARARG